MILFALMAVVIASVPLTGGRLSRLAEVELRGGRYALAALALQVAIVSVVPGGTPTLHSAVHLASYALAACFLVLNRNLGGIPLIALGGALNFIVIAANSGIMPASASALATAGLDPPVDRFANSTHLPHAHLQFLGDVIGIPSQVPLANVLSVGDLLLYAGALLLLHGACRPSVGRPPAPGRSAVGAV